MIKESTLDLIVLSDRFRRHADCGMDRTKAAAFVESARGLVGTLSHYYPEHPALAENMRTADFLRQRVIALTAQAKKAGFENVVLPVDAARGNQFAQFMRRQVLRGLETAVPVSLQREQYKTDLSQAGKIDKECRTVLDEGMRGFLNIKPTLKYGWDN